MCCDKTYQHKFDKKLRERIFNAYKFLTTAVISLFNCCKKVFILMTIWIIGKNLMKHHYLKKNSFSHLNMEDITDTDRVLTKRVCKDFEGKNLGQYHNLYVQRDALVLADVFENPGHMCIKMYELDPSN